MSDTPDLRIDLVSNPCYLCAVREFMVGVTRALGFPETPGSQVALAVDEALTNIMKHGYERRLDGPISVRVYPLPATETQVGVRIVIEDEARQVDPAAIRGRDLSDIRPGGLGVHIIRETMDEAVYERREAKGMRLTLVKRVAPGVRNPCCCEG